MEFTCPKCAEVIPEDSRKCRYCGDWTNPPVPGEEPRVDREVDALNSRGTTGFILSLAGLVSSPACGITILLCPIGWAISAGVNRKLGERGRMTNGLATAGVVLGIIGTILAVLALVVLGVVVAAAIAAGESLPPS